MLLFFGCADNKKADKTVSNNQTLHSVDTKYFYEPTISTLTGVIKKETFWGAPNFGEDTTVDSKEICSVLFLDGAIAISADSTDEFNAQKNNITKMQLVTAIKLDNFVGKKVTVKGQMFGAHTGHHHTDVLLKLTDIR